MSNVTPTWSCPVLSSSTSGEVVRLAHGEGGLLSRRLIQQLVLPILGNDVLRRFDDAARLPPIRGEIAFTTDSYVVSPLFFPGGDIGKLAVFGTTNDLIVAGARPRWLSLSLILEEGLPIELLRRVLQSVADAAASIDVAVVAGDTKVVPRGAADQLFLNTSGIGELLEPVPAGPAALQLGDELLVTGDIGQHGIAILACRENLGFEPPPLSDCASLWEAAQALRDAGLPVRAMRDATRGGVGAVLHEWASACRHTLAIESSAIPVAPEARGICELLGLDPLFLANEGTMVVAVPDGTADRALDALHRLPQHKSARCIGAIRERRLSPVLIRRGLGQEQPLDEPIGAALPRIC
ncbi:MAG: hydrogenase expression/formation protein HypE [Planctomycetota bacterium]|nr:MAG: hydrogenase expression/formation protein HypE [Planctomycetota bacterium]